ncbi:hypothetical protein ACUOFC_59185, partial [Escherichia sp. TWPC-MK]
MLTNYPAHSCWQDTCDYYNQMMERERLTVCFHAQLKQRHATMRFEEMNDVERERLVGADNDSLASLPVGDGEVNRPGAFVT